MALLSLSKSLAFLTMQKTNFKNWNIKKRFTEKKDTTQPQEEESNLLTEEMICVQFP